MFKATSRKNQVFARMERCDEDVESRLRALEGWRAEKAGEERRRSGVWLGGSSAVIVRVFGGG